jgi:hypothetical protein
MVGFLFLDILNYALYLTFTVQKCAIGNTGAGVFYPYSVPTGLPTSRPYGTSRTASQIPPDRGFLPTSRHYGTPENNGPGVFYPHSVPTGLREIPGLLFSTHIPSLRDSGKHRGRLLSTCTDPLNNQTRLPY